MSELSDREDRFVEDRERIKMYDAENLLSAGLQPPQYLVIRNGEGQDVVKVHFDGTLEYGESYDPDEAARLFWEAIGNWVVSRDALLAEAAEVLREFPVLPDNAPIMEVLLSTRNWHEDRAKPLLDKLEQ